MKKRIINILPHVRASDLVRVWQNAYLIHQDTWQRWRSIENGHKLYDRVLTYGTSITEDQLEGIEKYEPFITIGWISFAAPLTVVEVSCLDKLDQPLEFKVKEIT